VRWRLLGGLVLNLAMVLGAASSGDGVRWRLVGGVVLNLAMVLERHRLATMTAGRVSSTLAVVRGEWMSGSRPTREAHWRRRRSLILKLATVLGAASSGDVRRAFTPSPHPECVATVLWGAACRGLLTPKLAWVDGNKRTTGRQIWA